MLVQQCKNAGTTTGISTSFNGEVVDALMEEHPFLKKFDVYFISGKRGMMTNDPAFYTEIVAQFPGKKIYLLDAPGPVLEAAKTKGITPIEFVAREPDAIGKLHARLQAEGLCQ
jgi:hypothetical protein